MLLQRLRDISQQDKNELQHTSKELEKLTTELTSAQQRNESLKEELAKAEDTIDELKEQVTITISSHDYVVELLFFQFHLQMCNYTISKCDGIPISHVMESRLVM